MLCVLSSALALATLAVTTGHAHLTVLISLFLIGYGIANLGLDKD